MKNFDLINHIQTAVAIIDKDMTIIEANDAFKQRGYQNNHNIIGKKCFNAAYNLKKSCSSISTCHCPVTESFKTKATSSIIHHFWLGDNAVLEEVTATPIIEENGDVNYVVEEFRDISKLLGLEKGVLSVCSFCKKIENEDGQWIAFDEYLFKRTGVDSSHGICNECNTVVFGKYNNDKSCST